MTVAEEKIVKQIVHQIGLLNNLRDVHVEEIVNSQFKFIYETIRKLQFDGLSSEEIDSLDLNFILKHIGKIHTSSEIIGRVHKRKSYIKKQEQLNGN